MAELALMAVSDLNEFFDVQEGNVDLQKYEVRRKQSKRADDFFGQFTFYLFVELLHRPTLQPSLLITNKNIILCARLGFIDVSWQEFGKARSLKYTKTISSSSIGLPYRDLTQRQMNRSLPLFI
jgi:hypothetical protein